MIKKRRRTADYEVCVVMMVQDFLNYRVLDYAAQMPIVPRRQNQDRYTASAYRTFQGHNVGLETKKIDR